jgi:probable F420-dependent oxidoreductase
MPLRTTALRKIWPRRHFCQRMKESRHMSLVPTPNIGKIGIWAMELRFGDPIAACDAAAEMDDLGYGALWIPGGLGGDMLNDLGRLLDATQNITIASGILNIWKHDASEVGAWWRALPDAHRGRLLLGLGVSHSAIIGEAYQKPLAMMRDYLTALSAENIPADVLCMAALGPKMLELARDKTAGAHPYLVNPAHTAIARAALGSGRLLAPEQGVVIDADVAKARDVARPVVASYAALENYANSWRRLGFSEDAIANISDDLIDALIACGDVGVIKARVDQHLAAGADHVCLQIIGENSGVQDVKAMMTSCRTLAAALL